MALPPIDILDPDDPRVADYRSLKERRLNDEGRFIAESERVVRRLVDSGLAIQSVLLTAPRLATLGDALGGDFPVYLAPQGVVDQIAGFHVHRGCLAVGVRPPAAQIPRDARTLIVLEDLTDVDNLGAIARHAAAFGADAILLSPRSADPFYRKAIRVSLGAVFTAPDHPARSLARRSASAARRGTLGDRRRARCRRGPAHRILPPRRASP